MGRGGGLIAAAAIEWCQTAKENKNNKQVNNLFVFSISPPLRTVRSVRLKVFSSNAFDILYIHDSAKETKLRVAVSAGNFLKIGTFGAHRAERRSPSPVSIPPGDECKSTPRSAH